MKFYLPFDMIKFFFSKSSAKSGAFRHTQSHRIYCYLLFFKSGRTNSIKDLTTYFKSSKQNIQKSLAWLLQEGLINIEDDWIETVSKDKIYSKLGIVRSSWSLYEFEESDLTNPNKFKAKIYKYNCQNLAEAYGKKNWEIVGCSEESTRKGDSKLIKNYTNCTQSQSLSYLSKCLNRDEKTIQKRIKTVVMSEMAKIQILSGNTPFSKCVLGINESVFNVKPSVLEILTESGWKHLTTKEFSKIVASNSAYNINKELEYLRKTNPDLVKGCFIYKCSKTYYIARKATNVFQYSNQPKVDRKCFYKKLRSSKKQSAITQESLH